MRLRKKILIVGADPDRVSVLKFILDTNGYATTTATSPAAALDQLRSELFTLLLCEQPIAGIVDFLDQARTIDSSMRTLVTGACAADSAAGLWADAVFYHIPSSSDLLDRMKILCFRKHGPVFSHKSVHSVPVTPSAEAERAA